MKKEKLILKGGYVPVKMDDVHEHNIRTNTGCGSHKSKKDYTRKPKHKTQYDY